MPTSFQSWYPKNCLGLSKSAAARAWDAGYAHGVAESRRAMKLVHDRLCVHLHAYGITNGRVYVLPAAEQLVMLRDELAKAMKKVNVKPAPRRDRQLRRR